MKKKHLTCIRFNLVFVLLLFYIHLQSNLSKAVTADSVNRKDQIRAKMQAEIVYTNILKSEDKKNNHSSQAMYRAETSFLKI